MLVKVVWVVDSVDVDVRLVVVSVRLVTVREAFANHLCASGADYHHVHATPLLFSAAGKGAGSEARSTGLLCQLDLVVAVS